jgi:MYXO-CTERM domain-containing protein
MKKILMNRLSAWMLLFMLALAPVPMLAQDTDGPDLAEDVDDDDDDGSKLGLLGLLGLAGLAGLKKKPDVHVHADRDPVRGPRP